jgi:NAD(P)H-dependent flavin oxidoreductase YrpB (nitropropane dioxygenase family)
MKHLEFLGCKYPIVAVAMNRVSDLRLAVACHKAGIYPASHRLTITNGVLGSENFRNDLKRYANLPARQML